MKSARGKPFSSSEISVYPARRDPIYRVPTSHSQLTSDLIQFGIQVTNERGRVERLVEPTIDAGGPARQVVLVGKMSGHGEDAQTRACRVLADGANGSRAVAA